MDNLSIFVERLKEYMEDCRLNETDVAKALGCRRETVCTIINKPRTPSTNIFIKLLELFDCSADYLLGLTEFSKETQFKAIKPFGDTLRLCLTENEISEYKLQKDLDISGSLTYRWLRNIAVPTLDSLINLSKYFNCSVDYLLGRE